MLSNKALRNQKRLKYLLSNDMKNKPVKVVPCDEDSQVYNWQRTYKKAAYKPFQVNEKVKKELNQLKRKRNDKRNNKNRGSV